MYDPLESLYGGIYFPLPSSAPPQSAGSCGLYRKGDCIKCQLNNPTWNNISAQSAGSKQKTHRKWRTAQLNFHSDHVFFFPPFFSAAFWTSLVGGYDDYFFFFSFFFLHAQSWLFGCLFLSLGTGWRFFERVRTWKGGNCAGGTDYWNEYRFISIKKAGASHSSQTPQLCNENASARSNKRGHQFGTRETREQTCMLWLRQHAGTSVCIITSERFITPVALPKYTEPRTHKIHEDSHTHIHVLSLSVCVWGGGTQSGRPCRTDFQEERARKNRTVMRGKLASGHHCS